MRLKKERKKGNKLHQRVLESRSLGAKQTITTKSSNPGDQRQLKSISTVPCDHGWICKMYITFYNLFTKNNNKRPLFGRVLFSRWTPAQASVVAGPVLFFPTLFSRSVIFCPIKCPSSLFFISFPHPSSSYKKNLLQKGFEPWHPVNLSSESNSSEQSNN